MVAWAQAITEETTLKKNQATHGDLWVRKQLWGLAFLPGDSKSEPVLLETYHMSLFIWELEKGDISEGENSLKKWIFETPEE